MASGARWSTCAALVLLGTSFAMLAPPTAAPLHAQGVAAGDALLAAPASADRVLPPEEVTAEPVDGAFEPAGEDLTAATLAPAAPVEPAVPGLQVVTDTRWYDVAGATVDELIQQVSELGPRDASGAWGATTAWTFDWTHTLSQSAGACVIDSARVNLRVTFTYPRWLAPGDAAPELVATWARYVAATTLHENGHRDIAVQAGSDLLDAIRAVPAAGSCGELEQRVRSATDRVVASHQRRQERYDERTDHGAAQGAAFP